MIKNIEAANKIRELYATGKYSMQYLAEVCGCNRNIIRSIIRNITWIDDENIENN